MITIELSGATAEEIQFHVHQLARVFKPMENPHTGKFDTVPAAGPKVDKSGASDVVKPSSTIITENLSEIPKKRKNAKIVMDAPAATTPEVAQVVVAAPAPVVEPEGVPSPEETINALKSITAKYGTGKEGLQLVKDVLSRIGQLRITDVKPEQRAELIELCKNCVATGQA